MWLAALCCLAQVVGVVISLLSMDRIGRRATALRSCVGVFIALCVLSVSFQLRSQFGSYLSVAALMFYLVAFGAGLSGVPWVLNSEIYPIRVRPAAVGQATMANWLFNWLVADTFLSLCAALGEGGAFSIFAVFSAAGGLWLLGHLPETMHVPLEDIPKLFEDESRRRNSQEEPHPPPT